jgi:hypothetical protein
MPDVADRALAHDLHDAAHPLVGLGAHPARRARDYLGPHSDLILFFMSRGETARMVNMRRSKSSTGPLPVVSRWEWRLIARALPIDPARLTLEAEAISSRETYLLSAHTPHNVKIRKQVLEIKQFERRAADGLELWRPTARSAFPLDRATRTALWSAWGIPPQPTGSTDTLDALVREVVTPQYALRRVDLMKRRRRLTLVGCAGELVELEIGAERRKSIAFEDAHPNVVRAAVTAAGLAGQPNLNYPAALKDIVGLPIISIAASEGVR